MTRCVQRNSRHGIRIQEPCLRKRIRDRTTQIQLKHFHVTTLLPTRSVSRIDSNRVYPVGSYEARIQLQRFRERRIRVYDWQSRRKHLTDFVNAQHDSTKSSRSETCSITSNAHTTSKLPSSPEATKSSAVPTLYSNLPSNLESLSACSLRLPRCSHKDLFPQHSLPNELTIRKEYLHPNLYQQISSPWTVWASLCSLGRIAKRSR